MMSKVQPFEKYTHRYENWFEKHNFVYESEVQALKEHLPEDGKGIEIGVGSGRFALPLNVQFGLDPSKKLLSIAKKRGITPIEGVAENLPFSDGTFDFVLMVTTICFLDSIKAAFEEIFRILKPSGYFLVGFIDKENPLGKVYQKYKHENIFYQSATFYSVDEISHYLKRAGFRNFRISQTIFHELAKINKIEPIKKGYGEGSFISISAKKLKKMG